LLDFVWLLAQSVELAVFAWPVTLALLLAVGITVVRYYLRPARPAIAWRQLAVGLAFPLVVLLCGALRAATESGTPLPGESWASAFILTTFVVHTLFIGLLAWRAEGARSVVSWVGALELWWAIGALIVATMSVSGRWF
jgi:hypothetical protein